MIGVESDQVVSSESSNEVNLVQCVGHIELRIDGTSGNCIPVGLHIDEPVSGDQPTADEVRIPAGRLPVPVRVHRYVAYTRWHR